MFCILTFFVCFGKQGNITDYQWSKNKRSTIDSSLSKFKFRLNFGCFYLISFTFHLKWHALQIQCAILWIKNSQKETIMKIIEMFRHELQAILPTWILLHFFLTEDIGWRPSAFLPLSVSLFLSIYLCILLFCIFVSLSLFHCVFLCLCVSVPVSIYLSVSLSLCFSVSLSLCLSVSLSLCLSVSLSLCLPVSLSLNLSLCLFLTFVSQEKTIDISG
jgi:hypothetical protein